MVIEEGYFDRTRSAWITTSKLFQKVVAYRQLADNALNSLQVGARVVVTGKRVDDPFTPNGSDRVVHRDKLEASDIGGSLRFTTAAVTKNAQALSAVADEDRFATARWSAIPAPRPERPVRKLAGDGFT